MAMSRTKFDDLIASEIEKNRGKLIPVKAGVLERLFVRRVAVEKLHPNDEDEFCDPSIGPNYGIISQYRDSFLKRGEMKREGDLREEPLMVEKVYPDGYLILNGHHRWIASLMAGRKKVPIYITNLTHEGDIQRMVSLSKHSRRATLDLDEVVFNVNREGISERAPAFPFNKIFKERMRLGIPALLHFLSRHEYDVWVYTSKYYSMDYIEGYFKRYSVKVDGIVTGLGRKTGKDEKKRCEDILASRYAETLHIDANLVVRTIHSQSGFEEYPVPADIEKWADAVMEIVRGISKAEASAAEKRNF